VVFVIGKSRLRAIKVHKENYFQSVPLDFLETETSRKSRFSEFSPHFVEKSDFLEILVSRKPKGTY